ncbi:helix-turn-helix transcriptional regulator [Solibacillus sp. CAU 1738]|uniref:helix-turn-helix domain-containing protein n=1 Tax=Solibacillus sp. CAU 1738 TaxID=3140363 RepID=UPI00325FE3C0
MFGKILAKLRKERKMSQYDLAEKMGFSRGQLANYEQGTRQPDFDTLQKLADYFDVSVDYLLGREIINTAKNNEISKEERDIAKRLKQFEEEIENSGDLAFNGEPMSQEAKESLLESMALLFRQTQRINRKYTPKKYREDE